MKNTALLIATLVSIVLLFHGVVNFLKTIKTRKNLVFVDIENLSLSVKSLVKHSRFTWVEYHIEASYLYLFQSKKYHGSNLFLRGGQTFETERQAQQIASEYEKLKKVKVNGNRPTESFLIAITAPSKKSQDIAILITGFLALSVVGGAYFCIA